MDERLRSHTFQLLVLGLEFLHLSRRPSCRNEENISRSVGRIKSQNISRNTAEPINTCCLVLGLQLGVFGGEDCMLRQQLFEALGSFPVNTLQTEVYSVKRLFQLKIRTECCALPPNLGDWRVDTNIVITEDSVKNQNTYQARQPGGVGPSPGFPEALSRERQSGRVRFRRIVLRQVRIIPVVDQLF